MSRYVRHGYVLQVITLSALGGYDSSDIPLMPCYVGKSLTTVANWLVAVVIVALLVAVVVIKVAEVVLAVITFCCFYFFNIFSVFFLKN